MRRTGKRGLGDVGQVLTDHVRRRMHVGDEQLRRIGQLVEVGDAILVQRHHRLQAHPVSGFTRGAPGGWRPRRRGTASSAFLMYCALSQFQLLGVELRRPGRDVVEVEPFDELPTIEDFIVAMAPAQARQVVDHRLGRVAVLVITASR